jgi:hypothetical protein
MTGFGRPRTALPSYPLQEAKPRAYGRRREEQDEGLTEIALRAQPATGHFGIVDEL